MKFLDLFAGVGGFRRGLELAGHECVGFCEWDKYAAASYISMHLITDDQRKQLATMPLKQRQKEILKSEYRNGEWYASDIREVDAGSVPRCDCWCFGAPCQDFSVAGKRAGLDGDRSSLVREVFRILEGLKEEDRPEWLIYENVKGMLSSNGGLDYLSIIAEMDRGGYDVEWQTINSAWFVPQNRERIYTIGHLRNRGGRKIFPVQGTDRENSVLIRHDAPMFCDMAYEGELTVTENARCLKARYYKGVANHKGQDSGVCIPVITPDRMRKSQNGRRFKDNGEPSFTLTAQDRHGVGVRVLEIIDQHGSKPEAVAAVSCERTAHPGMFIEFTNGAKAYAVWYPKYQCYIAIRKLTPKECFRLQGWTDDYFEKAKFVNSDSQLYKQAGNGVTVDVVRAIGEK